MSGTEHATVNNENVKRLLISFGSDIVIGVMRGRMLTKKRYFLSLGLHSMIGTKTIITILNKLGHCLNYNKTCEIETASSDSTSIRAKEKNILTTLPVGDEIIITFFWTDNFDVNIESQKGGGSIHTTHLMTFQESVEGIPNNTNSNISLQRSKRKISIDPAAESALPSINENAEPTKFNQIIKPNSVPSRFFSLYDLWLLFRKWNSVDQTVPIFSGWLINIRKKHSTNLIKTTETYLPSILSRLIDFSSIQKYIEY